MNSSIKTMEFLTIDESTSATNVSNYRHFSLPFATKINPQMIGIIIIFTLVLNCASAQEVVTPECTYEHDVRTYTCKNVFDVFPKQYYGNYHLKCGKCLIPIFSTETFPYENNLISFNVSNSKVQLVTEKAFSHLGNVQYIYLNGNGLQNISEDAFDGLHLVYELHLEQNRLKELTVGFLRGLEANSVTLNDNLIEELKNDVFTGVLNILILNLSFNKIHLLHTRSLQHLDELEHLLLNDNQICHLPLGVFGQLQALTHLNLANNKLRALEISSLSGLTNLITLNISGNNIADFDGAALLPLSRVSHLDISRNFLFYLDPYALRLNAPTLRVLTFEDNLWSCNVLKNILQYFKSVSTKVANNFYRYNVQNVMGIACTDVIVTEKIDFELYMKTVTKDTEKYRNVC